MELYFLALLVILMATALASGYPVAFALPGSAILTIATAAAAGWLFADGDTSAYFAQGDPVQWLSAGVTNFRGIYWEAERDTLIAIPLFIFMGIMLQRSKIAEDLLVTMAQLFGPIPGGLGISVVFVGALLAATTGIVGATVVAMGLISLPAMLRNNYSRPLATGTIAASGTLGQIIPPSIVLIILADQLASAVDQAGTARNELYKAANPGELSMPSEYGVVSTSAGDMFLGAFVPGLLLVGLYMTFILVFALLRPGVAPAVPYDGAFDRRFYGRVLKALVPPLTLIFVVLGSILTGIATVNQAGAIGAVGAMLMAGYRLREGEPGAFAPSIIAAISVLAIFVVISFFDTNIKNVSSNEDVLGVALAALAVILLFIAVFWSGWRTAKIEDTLKSVMIDTAKTTSLVFIILLGAAMLTAAFRAFGGEELVKEFLNSLPGGFWTQFIIVMAVIFVLGFFLDFIEIAVVVVPIVAPILLTDPGANITAVWLGVMIGLNIQTSFLTPPFGFALFYLRGVAPPIVKTTEMYRGVIAFILLQLTALGIVGMTPSLVNYLPTRLSLTSDNAPPPSNPRLQYCLEEYVGASIDERSSEIEAALARARAIDLSGLPEDFAEEVRESVAAAETAIGLLAEARAAEEAIFAAAPAYRPMHTVVRQIERDIRRIDGEIDELERVLRFNPPEDLRERNEARIAVLQEERAALEAEIPAEWSDTYSAFHDLRDVESDARRAYRRAADASYEPIDEVVAVIEAAPALAAVEGDMRALLAELPTLDPEVAGERIRAMSGRLNDIPGTNDIRSDLRKARRHFTNRRGAEVEDGLADFEAALAVFEADLAWRQAATDTVAPELRAYLDEIGQSVGMRARSELSRDAALYIASCNAGHRNLSLSF